MDDTPSKLVFTLEQNLFSDSTTDESIQSNDRMNELSTLSIVE